jgi:hypothetical protein
MTKYSLEELKQKVDELAQRIKCPQHFLPSYGEMKHDAHPYVDIDRSGTLYYIVKERGHENKWLRTYKLQELLYWVFEDVTWRMALEFEIKNRIEDKDCRRIMFQKEEELLGQLDELWQQKKKEEHDKILLDHPFDDFAGLRAIFFAQLRMQGLSELEINKKAYEKYPRN